MISRTRAPLAAGATVAALTLTLTGCAGGAAGQNQRAGDEETLTVFAAASLAEPMDELLDEFAQSHPQVQVQPAVYDGSATLVTQLSEGAEADVLATANTDTMDRLLQERDGPADGPADASADGPELFATNTLVIAVPEGNPLGIESLADLHGTQFAVCAPEVPCGAAAEELFELSNFDGAAISQEQNVTAATQRVLTGAADAALVYATDVAARGDELDAVVPEEADAVVNEYPIVTLKESPAAQQFTDLVLSGQGRQILADYGFGTP